MTENRPTDRLASTLALLVPLLLGAAALLFYLHSQNDPAAGANDGRAEVAALANSIPLHATAASDGNLKAFDSLESALARLNTLSSTATLPGSAALWQRLQSDAGVVVAAREPATQLELATNRIAEQLPEFAAGGRELLESRGAALLLERFDGAVDELGRSVAALAAGVDVERQSVTATASADYLGRVLGALGGADDADIDIAPLTDSARVAQLEAVQTLYTQLAGDTTAAANSAGELIDVRESTRSLYRTAESLYAPLADARTGSAAAFPWLALLFLGLALVASVWLAAAYFRAQRVAGQAGMQADQNDRNQQAILRLLDELGSLADGDLTVQATVTEDITGAIADSINYAIEALRDLVATINDTAIMVDSAAKQTEAAAQHMSQSAKRQGEEVAATTNAVGAIVASIEQVSGNAERSSDVARHSVDVAHKGGEAVRRTIDGMNAIRETIQETSKRIKRLGESSQEIGNIVELINDIAEQTNILALNASIQASMAGEAGRGFAVVADEVQRLAERSTNATKQIEVLVRTIQADTNEAVVSMERSTTDVVGGALLAENAGAALDEIEQVSNQIASLVQNISDSAREQSGVASDIDKRTENLRTISEKAGRETAATAAAIHKLSELATQLRQTVSGFQLPDFGANSGVFTTGDSGILISDGEPDAEETESRAAGQA